MSFINCWFWVGAFGIAEGVAGRIGGSCAVSGHRSVFMREILPLAIRNAELTEQNLYVVTTRNIRRRSWMPS